MAHLAKNVVDRRIAVPGVQPKLSLSLIDEIVGSQTEKRFTVVGALGGNYIFKPPSDNFPEMPQNEHLTMRIAEKFGIPTVPSSLIRMQSGELSYITKRIDRTKSNGKIHMLDMFQILGAFDKYKGSMERVGKAIDTYSENTLLDKLYFFEIALFSFLTGNNDMHLKNFSLFNPQNVWQLAPAYDLLNVTILNPEDQEELALTLEGKKRKLKRANFEQLGQKLGLNSKQITNSFDRFFSLKSKLLNLVSNSFLSEKIKADYSALVEKRYSHFYKN
jgi:serine/threonine-protein kinase HipA